jgi:hypothetical protein
VTGGGAALPALDVNFSRRAATAYMPTARYWLGRAAGALEAVEDQVEPELVLVAVVVAGLQDVLECQLSEVGYSSGENRVMIVRARSAVCSLVSNGRLASCSAKP